MKPEQQKPAETQELAKEEPNIIPPQYKGMPSEVVEELWQSPVFVDEEKNISEVERKQTALEAIKKKENDRETAKQKYLTEKYKDLNDKQKDNFPSAQSAAIEIAHEYIQGKKEANLLSDEESFVIGKLNISYEDFKKENPDKPFSFDFSREIDRSVYNNLVQKLAFQILEQRQHIKNQEEANITRKEIGIPPQEIKEVQEPKIDVEKNLSIEERKKISGWDASYELAKIAKQQNIDLSQLSRENYMKFAIDNSLAIDDNQLRMSPWQRTAESVQELLAERKKRRSEIEGGDEDEAFARFEYEIKNKAGEEDISISNNVRIRSGTKDSNSWLFFGINDGIDYQTNETYKSYISVQDITTLSPERFKLFMTELQKNNYHGDIKIFQDMSGQGMVLNDQIVMHGRTQEDAKLALEVAENFFGNDLDQKSFGKDEIIDGKSKSYSQVLADKIKEEINKK